MQIKDLVADVILRELDGMSDDKLRAKALLNLVLTDNAKFRAGLVGTAFTASPAIVVTKLPALFYQLVKVVLSPLRG